MTDENEIDTSKVVLWQYDRAQRLLNLLEAKEDVANLCVGETWDAYYDNVFSLYTCNKFGLWIWGAILGIARPTYGSGSSITAISDDAYRRVLIARFYWMNAIPSMSAAAKYFSLLLDCGADSSYPYRRVNLIDNYDMTMTITLNWVPDEETTTILTVADIVNHPTGVEVTLNFPREGGFLGFDGYYNADDTSSTRKGMEVTQKTMWGYSA